jgi:hypothetical protein
MRMKTLPHAHDAFLRHQFRAFKPLIWLVMFVYMLESSGNVLRSLRPRAATEA